jgi:hypothetical protein
MLCFFERRPKLRDFKSEISDLKSLAESCSRQIRGWADSLQNSDIKGQRHLNDHSHEQWQKKNQRKQGEADWAETQRKILRALPPDSPARAAFEKIHGPL